MRSNYYLQFFDDIIKGEFHPKKLLQLPKAQLISRILAHQSESDIIIHKVIQLSVPEMATGEIRILKLSSNIFPYPIKTSSYPKTVINDVEINTIASFLSLPVLDISIIEVKVYQDESVVTLSYPLDLESLDVNHLAYFYFNLSLKTQVDEMKANLRLSILKVDPDFQSPKSMIGSHLELIIHNIAIFYRRLDKDTYNARTEMPINPAIQDYFILAGLYCEKVQRFLHHHFEAYIDREKPTNPLLVDTTQEQIKGLIKHINESLEDLEDPCKIIPELQKHLNELSFTTAVPSISYNRLAFLVNLINRLHELFQTQHFSSTNDIAFIELLIDCNLNTNMIITAVTKFIDRTVHEIDYPEHRIDYLRRFIKNCNQYSLIQQPRYNLKITDLSEVVIKYCQLSIEYIKDSSDYISSEFMTLKERGVMRKIRVNMNVTEMGGWCKFLVLSGIVKASDMPQVIDYLCNVIIPSDLEELKKTTLKTRFNENIKQKTIEDITGRLALFRKNLRSH